MSRKVTLGHFQNNGNAFIADLDIILRSSALFQANSGGGKSWALRRMIEQSVGKVQQIVIDPEGEFATLREKFDFILVGQDGETPVDVRSAPLLARKLLEIGSSAIVDLYEVPKEKRLVWTATFINALVDAPKALWRNLLVYFDEAHEFAPEPGHGGADSQAARACRSAMIDFAAKGRKRGYGAVAATQRLGKLSKDFAAELKNVMIGQTWIDIDRERAAESLGIAKAEKQDFFRGVKNMEPGSFFVLGRAFAIEAAQVKIGPVQTSHPEPGIRQSAPPPPTDKIRHLLSKLADLPKEAEKKAQTEAELRAEITKLKSELVQRPKAEVAERKVEVPTVPSEWVDGVNQAMAELVQLRDKVFRELTKQVDQSCAVLDKMVQLGDKFKPAPTQAPRKMVATVRSVGPKERAAILGPVADPPTSLGKGEFKILTAVAQHKGWASREQLTVLTGYKRSTRDAYLQRLRQWGFISEDGSGISATEQGLGMLGPDFEPLPIGDALLEHWRHNLPSGERACLEVAVAAYPEAVDREHVSEVTGFKRSTRDAYLQRLASRRLIEDAGRGKVLASKELFG